MPLFVFLHGVGETPQAWQDQVVALPPGVKAVAPWLRDPAAALKESQQYKHLQCPHCGQMVRVPRGKGAIRVTCPRCHEKFDTRS